jgi:hypothetical protein
MFSSAAGLYDKIYNSFGTPDLLDDVADHWSSSIHEKEKAALLSMLHSISKEKGVRVTMISGDVHLGAYTYVKSTGRAGAWQATDPGFMPQIVTSGIGNNPPEDFVVKYVATCGTKPRKVAPGLEEYVGTLFKNIKTRTGSDGFNNRMNYCELGVKKVGAKGAKGMWFKMVFLGGHHITGDVIGDQVEAVVPPLLPAGSPEAAALEMEDTKAQRRAGCCSSCFCV